MGGVALLRRILALPLDRPLTTLLVGWVATSRAPPALAQARPAAVRCTASERASRFPSLFFLLLLGDAFALCFVKKAEGSGHTCGVQLDSLGFNLGRALGVDVIDVDDTRHASHLVEERRDLVVCPS